MQQAGAEKNHCKMIGESLVVLNGQGQKAGGSVRI